MVNAQRKALERLWKDRCTVYHRVKVTDPKTKLTDFDEKPLLQIQLMVIMLPRLPNP